jgi:hypothetical protein
VFSPANAHDPWENDMRRLLLIFAALVIAVAGVIAWRRASDASRAVLPAAQA